MQTEENRILTATYQNGVNFARIDFFMDDSASYVTGGEVSDNDFENMIKAQGSKVEGYTVTIKL